MKGFEFYWKMEFLKGIAESSQKLFKNNRIVCLFALKNFESFELLLYVTKIFHFASSGDNTPYMKSRLNSDTLLRIQCSAMLLKSTVSLLCLYLQRALVSFKHFCSTEKLIFSNGVEKKSKAPESSPKNTQNAIR